jgi:uncharacterized protein (DUF58 family)
MRRESLLARVRLRLAIPARRPSHELLEGEYGSIHRGRSMDFDDLREYTVGDDVKDIDWKATARVGRTLIKRYVATRRHAVLLVVDTGRTMAARADPTLSKRDLAVLAAGVVGEIASNHGDSVGLVAGPVADTASGIAYVPPRRGDVHLERLLRTIHDGIDLDGGPSDLTALLGHVARHFRRRMIVVVIADDDDVGAAADRLLRRLAAQHEVLFVTVGDVPVTQPALAGHVMWSVESGAPLASFFRDRHRLHDDLVAFELARDTARTAALARHGIAAVRIGSEAALIPALLDLLERQRLFGAPR